MRITTFLITVSLAVSVFAAEPTSEQVRATEEPAVVAFEVPGTQYRKHPDPTFPERSQDDPSTWDDTADTTDELRSDTESREEAPEIKPEQDLNNQVHDPLLESPIDEPAERSDGLRQNDVNEPIIDPIP